MYKVCHPPPPSNLPPSRPFISGGSAFNSIVKDIHRFSEQIFHIIGISDNGGSTREVLRVLGGPAIGDIRSRLVRLAATAGCPSEENRAVRKLLEYRLPRTSNEDARQNFMGIVQGESELWKGMTEPYKQSVRAFLVHFYHKILQSASVLELPLYDLGHNADTRPAFSQFDFQGGSIGNFVITGARLFFGSLEAAIFWFSTLAGVPRSSAVCPVINSNTTVTVGAKLVNKTLLMGQSNISHPPEGHHTSVCKDVAGYVPLPAKIDSLFYVNPVGGQFEVLPPVNPTVLDILRKTDVIIFSMGSLYTSIVPSLILAGVGMAIMRQSCPKILILNGSPDRETMWLEKDATITHMKARDFVDVIYKALLQNENKEALAGLGISMPSRRSSDETECGGEQDDESSSNFGGESGGDAPNKKYRMCITDVVYIGNCVLMDTGEVSFLEQNWGIKCHSVQGSLVENRSNSSDHLHQRFHYEKKQLVEKIKEIYEAPARHVSHMRPSD
jgi:cathepsin L